ncbi:MATE family efflux transporter [Oceanobacillus sp. Castelsardo]|uniref:MATE family efflux transporter n=1 Tax=Oceanobacillus sp. Castelsardo TaxID=1851204 RepID=UPI000837CAB2|nr:MATE family efflux transporter [Oceanobacillus sp. Castelsardo]
MYETSSLKEKFKLFTMILIPILVTQLGIFLMNFFDTVMSGQAGAADLAGVAIGSSLWVPVLTAINGILLAITPIIAQITGAGKNHLVSNKIQQSIYLAIALGLIVIIVGGLALNPILSLMDLEPEVHHIAKYYLISLGVGIIPLFIYSTLRNFMDALGQTRISMMIILISLPINIIFNYIFIFGKLGIPQFGGIGAGIATALTYWIVCIIALIVTKKVSPFRSYHVLSDWAFPKIKTWGEQLKIGTPIGFAMFFETSIFSAVTILMSVYSTYTIAAHQAAMNFASLLYMIPLSVGMALTIPIGFEIGAKRFKEARTYAYIGISGSIFIAILNGAILYVLRGPVSTLYNSNPEVIELTTQFITFAIFYQVADAFGAPIQGVLRGYKDVNITLIIALVSYWLIGLPTGWLLANYTSLEPFGYWVGITVGLSCGAIALFWRMFVLHKKYRDLKENPSV